MISTVPSFGTFRKRHRHFPAMLIAVAVLVTLIVAAAGAADVAGETILACGAFAGIVVGISRRPPAPTFPVRVPVCDRREEAAALIAGADRGHEAGDDREACRLLAQAYRVLLSCEHGLEIGATDREVLDHLVRAGVPPHEADGTLEACSRVAFGGAAVEAEDYLTMRRAVASGPVPGHR
jgi:hypothetical protein